MLKIIQINDKNPKFKVGDHVRISKYKNIFAKGYMPNWSEEIFIIKKIKNTVPWAYIISDRNGYEIIGTFYEKELQGTNQQEYRIERVIKKKAINYMSNEKVVIIHLIVGSIKKTSYKMSKYFPKPYESFGGDINVRVDLSDYATKKDIDNITHVDTSNFALKTNLANLKTKVDKLDINKLGSLQNNLSKLKTKVDKLDFDKLVPIPADLSKLSNVVKNEVVKKTEYNAKIKNIEDKVPDISNLATKTNLNTKIREVKNVIPSIMGLAATSALAVVKSSIPDTSNLVKKTNYNTKITEIEKKLTDHSHDKYITATEFNKLATDAFNARVVQANLVKRD